MALNTLKELNILRHPPPSPPKAPAPKRRFSPPMAGHGPQVPAPPTSKLLRALDAVTLYSSAPGAKPNKLANGQSRGNHVLAGSSAKVDDPFGSVWPPVRGQGPSAQTPAHGPVTAATAPKTYVHPTHRTVTRPEDAESRGDFKGVRPAPGARRALSEGHRTRRNPAAKPALSSQPERVDEQTHYTANCI